MASPREAVVRLSLNGGKPGGGVPAQDLLPACEPDLSRGPDGTTASLSLEENAIVLTVTARDTSGLRAALNAHLRCLSLAARVSAMARPDRRCPGGGVQEERRRE